jgi:hypothetical protein
VTQNKPVMRRLLNGYFDELKNQILNDPHCGIFQTLNGVRSWRPSSMQRKALLANAVMTITKLAKECDEISRII